MELHNAPSSSCLIAIAATALAATSGIAHAQSATLTSAERSVQANANELSTTAFGPWSNTVGSGSTNASLESDISGQLITLDGNLHAHWPAGNTASSDCVVQFTVPLGMSFILTGDMSAFVSSFGFNGPGWSTLKLTGPSGVVFSYVIEAFSGSPSSFNLALSGDLVPGAYELSFDAYGEGFGSSFMTSGVSDAAWNITFELIGLCGDGAAGSCFEAHPGPYCDDPTCCGAVCSVDAFCCTTQWDWICANEASQLCSAPCPGDFDGTGIIDAADLSLLLGAWGSATTTYDLNGDGLINGGDLAVLLGGWGNCT